MPPLCCRPADSPPIPGPPHVPRPKRPVFPTRPRSRKHPAVAPPKGHTTSAGASGWTALAPVPFPVPPSERDVVVRAAGGGRHIVVIGRAIGGGRPGPAAVVAALGTVAAILHAAQHLEVVAADVAGGLLHALLVLVLAVLDAALDEDLLALLEVLLGDLGLFAPDDDVVPFRLGLLLA